MEKQRSEFEGLLQSCDLYDTPFDQTQFEGDVTSLKEQLAGCDKVNYMYMYMLGVLWCFALFVCLFVCLFDLACFFLSSFSSLIKTICHVQLHIGLSSSSNDNDM